MLADKYKDEIIDYVLAELAKMPDERFAEALRIEYFEALKAGITDANLIKNRLLALKANY